MHDSRIRNATRHPLWRSRSPRSLALWLLLSLLFSLLSAACGRGDGHHAKDAALAADGSLADPTPLPTHACARAPLDRSVATSMYEAARCLFQGAEAPQKGVSVDAITQERIAVLRGFVRDAQGAALSDVRITVLGHPEFGETLSRGDGSYELAINGGGVVTLRYERAGLLPVQRHELTEWREFSVFPEITMLAESPAVTAVDLTDMAAPIVARGELISDESGTRRQNVLLRPGTRVTMTLPDGSRQPLTKFHLRVTEYTRGRRGPSAMPGDLPPSSGYTYAAEFSLDEARAARASKVEFDPPAIGYLDNFLEFPTGTTVPNGYYDAQRDQWEAGPSGRVVEVLALANGKVALDADGDGMAEDAASLLALGVDAQELAALATTVEPGKSFWRFPLPHFSPWDCNWPFGPPAGAKAPEGSVSGPPPASGCTTKLSGSIIGCETQTLGEVLPLSGTPYSLHYQSERTAGRRDANRLDIPLTGETFPKELKSIELEIEVLGRQTKLSLPPQPNARHTFLWDELDAHGRRWQGRQNVRVRIGYAYDGVYQQAQRFGAAGNGVAISGDRTRQEVTLWSEWRGQVGRFEAEAVGMGGWTIDAHHAYDARGGVLSLGSGRDRSRERVGAVITTVAGSGTRGFAGDEGAATLAQIARPHGIAIAADGTVFIADDDNHRIRRIASNGIISTYAGTGSAAFSGDGASSRAAGLNKPMGLALAPDGTLFVADAGNQCIRKIAPDGIISTVAGRGTVQLARGQTLPSALTARFSEPHALARSSDGALFIADNVSNRIYRLDPSGSLDLVAGGGSETADGAIASNSKLGSPLGLALSATGELYFTDWDNNRVRMIDQSGIITTVAGTGQAGFSGDGGPANLARLSEPHTVDVAADGSLYISDEGNQRLRRVAPDGRIETVAGGGQPSDSVGDNGPPTNGRFGLPRVVYVHKDGSIWVADYNQARVRRIRPSLPGFAAGEVALASEDGQQLFVFDGAGRHLRSLDAITNQRLLSLTYDAGGRLVALRDALGNETRVERDAQGRATAIVGPYGERSALAFDGAGYLAELTNAAGESTRLTYHAGGLLATLREPRVGQEDVHRFDYDELGRLVRDASPTGLVQTLIRTQSGARTSIEVRTGLGKSTIYSSEQSAGGVQLRTKRAGAGAIDTNEVGAARSVSSSATGTTKTVDWRADPRFGMQAPYAAQTSVKVGSLPPLLTKVERQAMLRDAADISSLVALTETRTINNSGTRTVWSVEQRTRTTTSPEGRVRIARWDERGQIVEQQVGSLLPERYQYDERGRLIAIARDTRQSRFAYDERGRLSSYVDPLAQTVALRRDPVGRVLETAFSDATSLKTSFDANANPTSITPPGRAAHGFGYRAGNLLSTYTPPAVGAPAPLSFSYDQDGRLANVSHPDGQSSALRYESMSGRLLESAQPEGALSYGYHATGQLESIRSAEQQLAFSYDGELQTAERWSGAINAEVGFTYDANLRPIAERVGTTSIALSYDRDGLLTKAGDETLRYDANGLLTRTELSGVSESWEWSGLGEPSALRVAAAGGPLFVLDEVRRDPLGRITSVREQVGGELHSSEYRYHERGYLSEVLRDGVSIERYSYDDNGNRLSATTAAGTFAASYDAQDRIERHGESTYVFSSNGALSSKEQPGVGSTRYVYGVNGALRQVTLPDGTVLDYIIDGRSRRVGKKRNGQLVGGFVYKDQLRPLAELDASGAVSSRFVYGARHVPDVMIKAGVNYRLVSDFMGSVRLVVNAATGEIAQRIDYDAFGNVLRDTSPGFQPFGFAGGLYDHETGLVRFGARDYDARVGRWTARDPILFEGGQANLYVYVGNNPTNVIDPDGRVAPLVICAIIAGSAVSGGVAGAFFGDSPSTLANATVGAAIGVLGGAASVVGGTGAVLIGGASFVASTVWDFGNLTPEQTAAGAATGLAGQLVCEQFLPGETPADDIMCDFGGDVMSEVGEIWAQ